MRMISKKSLSALLAVMLLCVTTIGLTTAYFSATDTAAGSAEVNLTPDTKIDEGETGKDKQISISNSETGAPVVVRMQIFGPDERFMTVTLPSGSSWTEGGDGWYYYTKVLQPGEATAGTVDAVIKASLTEAEQFELGDNFNVTVVHEAQVVTYNGTSVATPSGWDASISFTE